MQIIPLNPTPSQVLAVTLNAQNAKIAIYQKSNGLYLDLFLNDVLTVAGVICRNRVRLVREAYLGFLGDLAFYDTMGEQDPDYTGIGSRYLLAYLTPTEATP